MNIFFEEASHLVSMSENLHLKWSSRQPLSWWTAAQCSVASTDEVKHTSEGLLTTAHTVCFVQFLSSLGFYGRVPKTSIVASCGLCDGSVYNIDCSETLACWQRQLFLGRFVHPRTDIFYNILYSTFYSIHSNTTFGKVSPYAHQYTLKYIFQYILQCILFNTF